jgi:exo-beta-1,3-glucanase (GH17 family)
MLTKQGKIKSVVRTTEMIPSRSVDLSSAAVGMPGRRAAPRSSRAGKGLALVVVWILAAYIWGAGGEGQAAGGSLRCVAFSPYVEGYDPDYGPHPAPSVIDELLDLIMNQTDFRCIMTYGMLHGLDHVFEAAQDRGMKVIAIVWLGTDTSVNDQSIDLGIQEAKQYPETIVRVSCGSEVRATHGAEVADPIIRDCLERFRAGGISQPITSIDTWWGWCNESWPCQRWGLADDVDWIGINVFPWWENKYSSLFPCTTAAEAASFHLARFQDVMARYPGKEVILTEFGWPAGPRGYTETNQYTGQSCGSAGQAAQRSVIEETLAELERTGLPGVVFEAFREPWKYRFEGPVGPFWGMGEGTPPYRCRLSKRAGTEAYLPLLLSD